ncbi:unnamed protein product [Gordionus sp. m RMFG-2023]
MLQKYLVNGNYSNWDEWGSCSTTCGLGIKIRYRRCDNPYSKHGGICVGSNQESIGCENKVNCDPITGLKKL